MDDKKIINALHIHQCEIVQLARHRLPIIVGRMAKDHFQNNSQLGGFVNNGLNKWKETKRQSVGGKLAASQYGPLLSARNHLFRSIKYIPSDFQIIIANGLLYVPIHNWGATQFQFHKGMSKTGNSPYGGGEGSHKVAKNVCCKDA